MTQLDVFLNSVQVLDTYSCSIEKELRNHFQQCVLVFPNENGEASLHYTEAAYSYRGMYVQDGATNKPFQGLILDIATVTTAEKATLKMTCVDWMYQFFRQYINYSSVADVQIYGASEGEEEDIGKINTHFTGFVNGIAAAVITDTNKDWTEDDWTAPAGKYGLIVIKNPLRPADTVARGGNDAGAEPVANSYTNDDLSCTSLNLLSDEQAYLEFVLSTSIAEANISNLKVKATFENHYIGSADGYVKIWDYTNTAWITLEDITAVRKYLRTYEVDSSDNDLVVADLIDGNGDMKIRFTAGRFNTGGGGPNPSKIEVVFLRIELTYDEYPTLQFEIDSHTSDGPPETITATVDISGSVDLLDQYIIATRTDYIIKDVIDTYDLWQALTTTGVATGTIYVGKRWRNNTPASDIIRYCCELEEWDYWLADDLDFQTQASADAVASGLRFDESNVNLQVLASHTAALGGQVVTKAKVEWANGTTVATDATGQARYDHAGDQWIEELHVDHDILSSEEADKVATRLLNTAKTDVDGLVSHQYLYVTLGKSYTVNLPTRNISNATYLLKKITWNFTSGNLFNAGYDLGVPGSETHNYLIPAERMRMLQQQVRELRQQIATQPVPTSGYTSVGRTFYDEDDMASDDADGIASQQSIKAYADSLDHDHATPIGTHAGDDDAHHTLDLATSAPDVTATAAEVNVLDGIPGTLTFTELGYVDGVTSAIQTQIDTHLADVANPHVVDVTDTSPDGHYIILPTHFLGANGFVESGGQIGASFIVVATDTNAYVSASHFVRTGGSFKIRIIYTCSSNNSAKIASGVLYFTDDEAGEVGSGWDELNAVNADLALPATAYTITFYDHATAVTIDANTRCAMLWLKDDNAGGAAGNMIIYGVVLVRQ